jgi:hypothetical protein
MVVNQDIIGMKMPDDQKSERVLFYQLQSVIVQGVLHFYQLSEGLTLSFALLVNRPHPAKRQ